MECRYANIFGAPGTGVHAYKVLGISIVDVVGTVGVAYALANYTRFSFNKCLLFLLLVSVPIHYAFCVQTQGLKYLGLAT